MTKEDKKGRTKGRPPKFSEESGPITITLPRRITALLDSIDADRAKAIVKCVEMVADSKANPKNMIEILPVSDDAGLIVVPYMKSLKKISWLEILEISPFRYLLSIPSGTAIESLELALVDLIEHLPDQDGNDLLLLKELKRKIGEYRRESMVSKGELLFFRTRVADNRK